MMVKVDGAKAKRLREQKGLTQLYVATAVGVTTDTISRWENRRYPSIKRENGLLLAEALEVSLEEILEADVNPEDNSGSLDTHFPEPPAQHALKAAKRIWPLLLLSLTIGLVFAAVTAFFLLQPHATAVTATRLLPKSCPAGQPFPVAVAIAGLEGKEMTLILKERLPEGFTVLASVPDVPASGIKQGEIRWLAKVGQPTLFVYLGKLTKETGLPAIFTGTIAVGSNEGSVDIAGASTMASAQYHWADTDQDNTISDSEILVAYDRFGEIEALAEEMDRIEEIWLGSGYRWNQKSKDFAIIP